MRAWIGTLAAFAASGCAIAIDEAVVFRPQERASSWGDEPNDGIAGERHFADPDGYPADHGLVADVRHERVGDLRTSLVTLPDGAADRPLIVHCFGNGSDRWRSGLKYGRKLVPYGDVLLFDYPGYNGAPGAPTPAAFEAQADAVAAHARTAYPERARIYWGHSLGGFVCAEVASRDPGAAGLVLETTAPDVGAVTKAWVPWYAKPVLRPKIARSLLAYDTPRTAAATGVPVLVIGAGADEVLPVALSRELAARLEAADADATYAELAEAGHFDTQDHDGFDAAVRGFLARVK